MSQRASPKSRKSTLVPGLTEAPPQYPSSPSLWLPEDLLFKVPEPLAMPMPSTKAELVIRIEFQLPRLACMFFPGMPLKVPVGLGTDHRTGQTRLYEALMAGKMLNLEGGHHRSTHGLVYHRDGLTLDPNWYQGRPHDDQWVHLSPPNQVALGQPSGFGDHQGLFMITHDYYPKIDENNHQLACQHAGGVSGIGCRQCGDFSTVDDLRDDRYWADRGWEPRKVNDDLTLVLPPENLRDKLVLTSRPLALAGR